MGAEHPRRTPVIAPTSCMALDPPSPAPPMSPTLHPGVGDASVENAGLGGGGAWPQKGCSEVGASVLEARSVLGGCKGAWNEPLPTTGRILGGGGHMPGPLCAAPPAPRLLPAPSPPPRRPRSSSGWAARGWRLLPRAGSCPTEPGLSPGAARGPPCPSAAKFCFAFFGGKVRRPPAARSGTIGVPEHNPVAFGAHPGGSNPQEDKSQGEGGLQQFRTPRDGTGCVSGEKWGLASQGVSGASPIGSIPVFFFFFCPLLPRPVGPVEGAPGQQHVPD